MRQRKFRLDTRPLPKAQLLPHPPDRLRPVLADHSFAPCRTTSLHPESVQSSGEDLSLQDVQLHPLDNIVHPSPRHRGRRLHSVQPTQRPFRAGEGLSDLSVLAQEMKQLFECKPQLPTTRRTHRKMSKSMQYADGKPPRSGGKEPTSKSFYVAEAIYQKPPISLRTRRLTTRTTNSARTRSENPTSRMQEFFEEFHLKSRQLLSQLEQQVFGV